MSQFPNSVQFYLFYDYEHRVRSLPSEEALGKIIRYEAHLSRAITKDMTMLKALQAMRLNGSDIENR